MDKIVIRGTTVDCSGWDPTTKAAFVQQANFWNMFPLPGSINVHESAITDLRYRLIQLHEAMHALHHRFRSETRAKLRKSLEDGLNTGKLSRGPELTGPRFFPPGTSIPPGFKIMSVGPLGTCAIGQIQLGELIVEMLVTQSDELFVEFFTSAAAGAAYWTSARDFALAGMKGDRLLNRSPWYCEAPEVFDPHPALWVRFQLLPQLFLNLTNSFLAGSPIKIKVQTELGAHFDRLIKGKLPVAELKVLAKSNDGTKTYEITVSAFLSDDLTTVQGRVQGPPDAVGDIKGVELSAEAAKHMQSAKFLVFTLEQAGEVVGEYEIPIASFLPYLKTVYWTLMHLVVDWHEASHPLALLGCFFSPEYHDSIHSAAAQFAHGVPKLKGLFCEVISATAARLCFDLNPGLDLESLQVRARESLTSLTGPVWHTRLISYKPSNE